MKNTQKNHGAVFVRGVKNIADAKLSQWGHTSLKTVLRPVFLPLVRVARRKPPHTEPYNNR